MSIRDRSQTVTGSASEGPFSSSPFRLKFVNHLPQASDTTIRTKLKVVTKATGEGPVPLRGLRLRFVIYTGRSSIQRAPTPASR